MGGAGGAKVERGWSAAPPKPTRLPHAPNPPFNPPFPQVLGLAVYNAVLLDFPLPLALYRKLLGQPPGLRDLEEMEPALGRSLRALLDYDGPGDVEDVFCMVRWCRAERGGGGEGGVGVVCACVVCLRGAERHSPTTTTPTKTLPTARSPYQPPSKPPRTSRRAVPALAGSAWRPHSCPAARPSP